MSWLSLCCPACGRTFEAPAQIVGQKVLCPTCPTVFTAEPLPLPRTEPEPLPDDEPNFYPRRRRRMSRRRASGLLTAPGIALMVFGGIAMLLTVVNLVLVFMLMSTIRNPYPQMGAGFYISYGLGVIFGAAVSFAWGYMVLTAGYEIKNLGSYRHSIIGAISAGVPWSLVHVLVFRLVRGEWPPAALLWPLGVLIMIGLPLGLWALVLLLRPDVKRLFDAQEPEF